MSAASPPPSPSAPPPTRWLHLWAPTLPTDRLRRARPDLPADRPLAVTAVARNALRLVAVDALAAAEGLASGVTLKDARRIAPALVTLPEDPSADRALADRLLALCRLTAPSVARDGPGGFAVDVTGAARVHGGEAALAAAARARFSAEGVAVRWALADTPGLAWACALFGDEGVVAPGGGPAALAPLPVEALRLGEEDTADLRALGFRRIGPLLGSARALSPTLEGRLGARLDVVLGVTAAAVAAAPERARYVAERALPQPVTGAASVLAWTRRLLEALEPQLLAHGRGARVLELTLTRVDGARRIHRVRTRRPQTDPAALAQLFEGPLDTQGGGGDEAAAPVGAEIERLRLEARLTAPLRPVAGDLLRADEAGDRRFDALVESLCARLGEGVVEAPRRDPATLKPERQVRLAPLDAAARRPRLGGAAPPAPPPPVWDEAVLRPLRLFDPPEPATVLGEADEQPPFTFSWRRLRRRVVRAEGPERLAPEWGREPDGTRTRDYYRVEDADGRRYWLFREGLYGDETHPAWFVQGVFA